NGVIIGERENISPCGRNPFVQRVAFAVLWFRKKPKMPRKPVLIRLAECRSAIRRGIIDNDYFPIRCPDVGRSEKRFKHQGQAFGAVAAANDHADLRTHWIVILGEGDALAPKWSTCQSDFIGTREQFSFH